MVQREKSIKKTSCQSTIESMVDHRPIAFVCVSLPLACPSVPHPLTPHTIDQRGHPQYTHMCTLPTPPQSSSQALRAWRWGTSKQRALPGWVIPPLSRYTEVYLGLRTHTGTILSPFTVSALNELVESLY